MRRKPPEITHLELDDLDRAIIAELQVDGRRAYGKVAEAVGLSEFAARQRTQRLIEVGVIRIVAITDPDMLGRRLRATLCVQLSGDIKPVIDTLDGLEEVDFVVATAGIYDLMAEVQCTDENHLDTLVNGVVRKLDGVSRIDTMVYLRLHKSTYSWPPGSRLPGRTL